MIALTKIFVIICVLLFGFVENIFGDYCTLRDEDTCPNPIGCIASEENHVDVSNSTQLTPDEKYTLLNAFNELKNSIAQGEFDFKAAANATVIIWDDELEEMVNLISKYYSDEEPDVCLDTNQRKNNINDFMMPGVDGNVSPSGIITTTTNLMRSMEYISSLTEVEYNTFIHLTHIGCKYIRYDEVENEDVNYGIRCLYNFGNQKFLDFEQYFTGRPCSGCHKCHPIYTALCATS